MDAEQAVTATSEALTTVAEVLSAPEEDFKLGDVATGSYLGSVEATREQFLAEGLVQTGEVKVEDITILEELDDGSVRVQACVDSSDIQVLDENGVNLRGEGTFDRALTIFTLESFGDRWVIADETFGDPPEC